MKELNCDALGPRLISYKELWCPSSSPMKRVLSIEPNSPNSKHR